MKLFLAGISLLGISLLPNNVSNYPYRIGYIPRGEGVNSNPKFSVCNEAYVVDYYNRNGPEDEPATYIGGSKAIGKLIQREYPDLNLKDESGMLTIRFIINCKGQTGRFVTIENDLDFKPRKFDPEVKDRLLTITQKLDQWRPNFLRGQNRDCAMYITYKLNHGKIIAILP